MALRVRDRIEPRTQRMSTRLGGKLTVRPLTPDLWSAFVDLFGTKGACSRCWCMYWRIGAAYRQRPAEKNKAAFRRVVAQGPPPGLLAFHGDLAVGWCQLTPRDEVPWLDREWRLERVDDIAASGLLSCFYIRQGFRKQGVTSALIAAALKSRAQGQSARSRSLSARRQPDARALRDRRTPRPSTRAGFKTVARHVPPRPIMRYVLELRDGHRQGRARRVRDRQ